MPPREELDSLWDSLPAELRGQFETYLALLTKWQKSINLVSPSTLAHARDRHILDSYQLIQHIPLHVKTIYDLGSGAGFPAMVIAASRPDIAMHVIESDQRKCEFIRTISRENSTPVIIHMGRIEMNHDLPPPDMITARALANVKTLLELTEPWWAAKPDLTLLLPKGESWDTEITDAKTAYNFEIADYPSVTDDRARILRLSGITARP